MARTTNYELMGMAAILPGMKVAHESLGREIAAIEQMLHAAQGDPVPEKRGSYLSTLSPAERSAEMRRRHIVRITNAKAKEVPAAPAPAQAEPQRKKRSNGRANIEWWSKRTPEQKADIIARRVAASAKTKAANARAARRATA